MKLLSASLIRGLIGQVVGTLVGMGFMLLIRLALGLQPWKPEPVWVVGSLFGVIAFVIGTGVLDDWFKWMRGESTPEAEAHYEPPIGLQQIVNLSYDHKVIGIQYGITSVLMLFVAGLFAIIFRTELISPGMQIMVPDVFNTYMSLHGIVMIFGMLLGVGAMSNFLVPLLIGANDMAFPRLNAFAYWINVPAVFLLLSTLFLGGIDAGWTAYPPLSANLGKMAFGMFFLGVYVFGLSSVLGALNIIATTIRLRAPGMNPFRMPIFVWSALATAIIALTATQLIGLSFQLVLFERLFGMDFFNPNQGG
ncbi:MAG TPA: cbb3-type cytochrome c oxidase subunit I, partial [Anaerolineales bacterium]